MIRSEINSSANMFFEIHQDGLDSPILDLWWMAAEQEVAPSTIEFSARKPPWFGRILSRFSQTDYDLVESRKESGIDLLRSLGVSVSSVHSSENYECALKNVSSANSGQLLPYQNALGTGDHESGTLEYGKLFCPKSLSSFEFPNLYLAGSAGFPSYGPVNPTLTIIALSRLVASEILGC